MRDPRLSQLEEELRKIPGVTAGRVAGEERPSEIHIVASPERPPKQIVRDVQSLSAATFAMPIDHRIVSIVQLEENSSPPLDASVNGHRPVIERLVVASKSDGGWVKIAIRWPNGATTEGAAFADQSRDSRARASIQAAGKALEPALRERGAHLDVDHVSVQRLGNEDSVVVRGVFHERGMQTRVLGSALVQDDAATAAARAVLDAVNRKLA